MMDRKFTHVLMAALAVHVISASVMCPSHPNCVCGGTLAIELNCNIDGRIVKINLLPSTYINIKCENTTTLDYSQLPKCANGTNSFKSVSFKDCPLPNSSFNDILMHIGVPKTMSLIFQNAKELSGYFDRKHFAGLKDLTKLLLSVNGIKHLPDNLFVDVQNLTWLNIRCNNIKLSEELFKPLERLETLEISHNHMTNMSSNLFSHLTLLRKLSLWQSNVTKFSKDFFTGVDVLEELDLSSNGLNELPTSIFKPLRKLKKLTLFSNKFSTLPENLFSNNKKLETVIVLNNDVKMKELPRSLFGNLPNLNQVYIQRSGIEVVPYDIFTNSSLLKNISFAFNDIEIIPESTFNDQINLLELDLSHNNLKSLHSKLFSSLVRLEKLNLCYNSIEEVSGSTFSSLLSLIYLNMEHNHIKTISSYLFSNNRQRMSISFAYNELDDLHMKLEYRFKFGTKLISVINRDSPFAHTSLRLLNLSHNKFQVAFDDWWFNGHEILDISNNYIQFLSDKGFDILDKQCTSKYKKRISPLLKEIWITENPLKCMCTNFQFINYVKDVLKTKVVDDTLTHCSTWTKEVCRESWAFTFTITLATSLTSFFMIVLFYCVYKEQIHLYIKKKLQYFFHQETAVSEEDKNIIVKYTDMDEEFVLKEILPELKEHKNYNVQIRCINNANNKDHLAKQFRTGTKESNVVLIIFSPNYLTSMYSHVNIKKIRGEMLKSKNTVYVFTDIGSENSIYAFLKEQRDRRSTILWSDPNFWSVLIYMLSNSTYKKKVRIATEHVKCSKIDKNEWMATDPFVTTTSDSPEIYTSRTVADSPV
ncbi:protein toll-like [Bicyclus anynana]|uniref:Protein toll-like n=1 Tax=Bicyclus anynana TaxID=110368 RepID=A0A6J1MME8_BICAN|nr:protein toll-like [Bicyclus anynana]